ncbi:MAG TPA: PEP-CTERM sorting domain-containing protein [Candidatus Omnitrophota bacterium]|nr:PEP-CTERM sorting domain-containing protein [Candidatus Omnitrophota bacterium]
MAKRTAVILAVMFSWILLELCGPAFATTPTGTTVTFFGNNQVQFAPVPADLGDLDHSYAYTWGINYELPQNTYVDFASITFTQINNWQNEPNVLYVNLLDSAMYGVSSAYDGQASGNFFGSTAGAQLLTQYVDNDASAFENFTYTFNAGQLTALNAALADANFGIGFDPDCHYYNQGIKMDISTKVVPEPIGSLLFVIGTGVFGAAAARRRKTAR